MTTSNRESTKRSRKALERDPRFRQLLDLANDGNQEAIRDLWVEFGYDHQRGEA